jgi:hypothetical protein
MSHDEVSMLQARHAMRSLSSVLPLPRRVFTQKDTGRENDKFSCQADTNIPEANKFARRQELSGVGTCGPRGALLACLGFGVEVGGRIIEGG